MSRGSREEEKKKPPRKKGGKRRRGATPRRGWSWGGGEKEGDLLLTIEVMPGRLEQHRFSVGNLRAIGEWGGW